MFTQGLRNYYWDVASSELYLHVVLRVNQTIQGYWILYGIDSLGWQRYYTIQTWNHLISVMNSSNVYSGYLYCNFKGHGMIPWEWNDNHIRAANTLFNRINFFHRIVWLFDSRAKETSSFKPLTLRWLEFSIHFIVLRIFGCPFASFFKQKLKLVNLLCIILFSLKLICFISYIYIIGIFIKF